MLYHHSLRLCKHPPKMSKVFIEIQEIEKMSWSVRVMAPEGMPEANEKIASFCKCPGNMYMCVMEWARIEAEKYPSIKIEMQLRDMDRKQAISALLEVIRELDKGNRGIFNDDYAVMADEKWSGGEETKTAWKTMRIFPSFHNSESYAEYTGRVMRERCREGAMRFFLYYKAGYIIEYIW